VLQRLIYLFVLADHQALQGVGQELPSSAVLQTLAPDQQERVINGWVQKLRVLILLMVRWVGSELHGCRYLLQFCSLQFGWFP
jgi:hypothetical protein